MELGLETWLRNGGNVYGRRFAEEGSETFVYNEGS